MLLSKRSYGDASLSLCDKHLPKRNEFFSRAANSASLPRNRFAECAIPSLAILIDDLLKCRDYSIKLYDFVASQCHSQSSKQVRSERAIPETIRYRKIRVIGELRLSSPEEREVPERHACSLVRLKFIT